MSDFEPDDTPRINNLVGYYLRDNKDIRYGFTKGGLEEAPNSLNFKNALANLVDSGFLEKDGEGKSSVSKRVRGSRMRLYMISDRILSYETGDPQTSGAGIIEMRHWRAWSGN